jgi:dTDP-4-dehydrorhamnose 3,5-epimerase
MTTILRAQRTLLVSLTPGVYNFSMSLFGGKLIANNQFSDSRGYLKKTFTRKEIDFHFELAENFVSSSGQGVVRGIHLQVDPNSGWKLVSVLSGTIFDVLVDLRPNSVSFGNIETMILSADSPQTLIIPPGIGHGFQALEAAVLHYSTSYDYDGVSDIGVNINSLNIVWPLPITEISDRDLKLPSLRSWQDSAK